MNYGGKPKKTTNFMKKSEKDEKFRVCYVCGKEGKLAKNCRYRKDRDDGKPNKQVKLTIGDDDDEVVDLDMVIFLLYFRYLNLHIILVG